MTDGIVVLVVCVCVRVHVYRIGLFQRTLVSGVSPFTLSLSLCRSSLSFLLLSHARFRRQKAAVDVINRPSTVHYFGSSVGGVGLSFSSFRRVRCLLLFRHRVAVLSPPSPFASLFVFAFC